VSPIDTRQSLENLKLERDAIALYDALAAVEKEPHRATAFRTIAGNERRHADVWATKLRELGTAVPEADAPRLRVRIIILLARLFGTRSVADLVQALEGDEENAYTAQGSPEVEASAADERAHVEIWRRLQAGEVPAGAAGNGSAAGATPASTTPTNTSAAGARAPAAPIGIARQFGDDVGAGLARAAAATQPTQIARAERWHRAGRSGTLRAVIFGVSDGLVSNLSLVMGVAGASPDPHFILLAGIAGLLAGSFSMAAGEYISMQSQRELYERQIALERAELEAMPAEEEAELAAIYRSKGFTPDEASRIASRIFRDPQTALDTLAREELGLDPDELGSPWGAAIGSFLAFAGGAVVPVVPYLVATGTGAFVASLAVSFVALFAVGAGVSLLTGRSTLFSGARQVAIGAAAAAVTFLVGRLIGVSVGG
jgi:VIT1/CCC1 family predicted Fe2+/Mn2+ transporter/rubrerythrin